MNDYFQIKGLESVPDKKIKIYNRWGKLVYTSDDYQNDWNGGTCSDGVYFFVFIVPGLDKEVNSTITILR
jgi:gliding motility-associated-like protein